MSIALLLAPAVAGATGGPLPLLGERDDAGTGRDAPDDRSRALALAPNVRHTGDLEGFYDEDWYAFPGTHEEGSRLVLGTVGACYRIIHADGGGWARPLCPRAPGTESVYTVRPGDGAFIIGFVPFARANDMSTPATYRFMLESRDTGEPVAHLDALPHDDADSGRDAPDAPREPLRVEPGRAYDGAMTGLFDAEDHYAFKVPANATYRLYTSVVGGTCYGVYGAPPHTTGEQFCPIVQGAAIVTPVQPDADGLIRVTFIRLQQTAPAEYGFALTRAHEDNPGVGFSQHVPATPSADTVLSDLQDDAGTGGDAPDAFEDAHRVRPGEWYTGRAVTPWDEDWYALDVEAGKTYEIQMRLGTSCYRMTTQDTRPDTGTCGLGFPSTRTARVVPEDEGALTIGFESFPGVPVSEYAFRVHIVT